MLTAAATLALICLGGLVTSHGVGMAVPDWPNTYGYNMFFFPVSKWVGGIFYEHTHRLLGSLVGLFTLVLMLWLHGKSSRPWLRWGGAFLGVAAAAWAAASGGRKDWALLVAFAGGAGWAVSWFWPRCAPASPRLRWLGNLMLIGVILQGVLGGLRVVLMQDAIGIVHATLAQLFLGLACIVALLISPWWLNSANRWQLGPGRGEGVRGWVAVTALAILLQLVLGASMRHRHAGLAVPDFPLAYGRVWPATDPDSIARYNRERPELHAVNPIAASDIQLHMAHRCTALLVLGLLTFTAWNTRRQLGPRHPLSQGTQVWMWLGYVQLVLGAITVWSNKSADLATAHVAVGSALLAGGALLCTLAYRRSADYLSATEPTEDRVSLQLPKVRTSPT